MMTSDSGDERAVESLVADCLRDPGLAKGHLPRLLPAFESDDRFDRLCAAWVTCLAANDDPELVDYLVRRLTDRLTPETTSPELTLSVEYLEALYPDRVTSALEAIEDDAGDRTDVRFQRTGTFTRANYLGRSTGPDGVGRTGIAGPGSESGDPRQHYLAGDASGPRHRRPDATVETGSGGGADHVAEAGSYDDAGDDHDRTLERFRRRTGPISAIAARSRFDALHVLAARERGRFAERFEAIAGSSGDQEAILLEILDRPADASDRDAFADRIAGVLADWGTIADHPHVRTVLDWGLEPRPWLVTRTAGDSLADLGAFDVDQGIRDALALAEAVSRIHNAGVVHAGIDPDAVTYPADVLGYDDRTAPLLGDPGMMTVYRYVTDPALRLDPGYAAPEYFDPRYGRLDHATDVYQLGAVVFRMVTGRPPFSGTFSEVRAGVLDARTPRPSEVEADVPSGLDEVVAKAMATQKLTRYESVDHMRQELAGLVEGGDGGG